MSVTPEREELAARLRDYWAQTLPRQSSHMVPGHGPQAPEVQPEEAPEEAEAALASPSARERPNRPAPELRGSLIAGSDAGTLRPREQKVDRCAQPGWATGKECEPKVGDQVYCTAGPATVLRLLGKTGNGSRLLELRLPGNGRRDSFFAAASNVLVAPDPAVAAAITTPQETLSAAGAPSDLE
jgi:hypothetical protein